MIHPDRRNIGERSALVDEVEGLLLDQASKVLCLAHEMKSQLRDFANLFVRIWEQVSMEVPLEASHGDEELIA